MNGEEDRVVALGRTTIAQIEALIAELDALSAAHERKVAASTKMERREMVDPIPGLHDFVTSVKGTKKSVHRVLKLRAGALHAGDAELDPEERDNKGIASILACGYSSHQNQWDVIKRVHGLFAFRRRFGGDSTRLGITVDAVAMNGNEWIKVSTATEKKLIYEIAQEGWHPDDSTDDCSDGSDGDDTAIGIVKITRQLIKAARANRCNTRIPRIRLVLSNLVEGRCEAIDRLLNKIRIMGISKKQQGDVEILVDCSNSSFLQAPVPQFDTAVANIFRDTRLDRLTPTLNLELTILLSLVSDIAHTHVERKEWYSKQTLSHLEDEAHAPGSRLQRVYAALRGKRLECTQDVFQEFCNVVDDLGTEDTKTRAAIIFGRDNLLGRGGLSGRSFASRIDDAPVDGQCSEPERNRLVEEWRKLSIYPVLEDLHLPIQVIGHDVFNHNHYPALIEAGKLPPVAAKVWEKLDRAYNRSCHLWGWIQDITTLSANSLNTRLIDAIVDQERTSALDVGPRLYLSALAISLNTAKPCPADKWDEMKDLKYERKEARTKEAKKMKAAGTWGPNLGVPVKWDEKQFRKQDDDRMRGGALESSGISQRSSH